MLSVILLKSLEAGFTSLRDLQTIVEACADQYGVDTIVPTKLITHYNHTSNFDTILRCLRSNITKNYVIKPNRNQYKITAEGIDYVKSLSIDVHLFDYYMTIINNTEKEVDMLRRAFQIKLAEAALHPIRLKYYKDDKLIPEITDELKDYTYFYHIDDDKLKLDVFGFKKTLSPESFLYQDDIILYLNEEELRFRDL